MENQIINATNEQIELVEDKNATLTVRTKESLRQAFKSVQANTDNDKLVKLLELYEKYQATQDKFSIDSNLDMIDKAFGTITNQLKAITSSVNQYERTLTENYIVDVADEMKILKEQIENEEILRATIIGLEKDLELLNKRYQDKEQIVFQSIDKIKEIEADNKKYIALNSELVSKENDYINQLRVKDSEINSKILEISYLVNDYEDKIKSLEGQYKANIEQLEIDNKAKLEDLENTNKNTIKELENKLIEADKEKAILETKINSLETNVKDLGTQNTELKENIELVRKEAKEDIKALEKEHRAEIKALEKEVSEAKETNNAISLEKAKLEAKVENLEGNINTLNKDKESLEGQIKGLETTVNTLNENNEGLKEQYKALSNDLKNKVQEVQELGASLADAKAENKALKDKIEKPKAKKSTTKED